MEFFRHCPQCGRRFHIKLETKKLVSEHREKLPGRKQVIGRSSRSSTSPGAGLATPNFTPIAVQEGKPIIVDIEEFQYMYKCAHCGHEWSENHLKVRKEG